jgi:hypothetical protein
MRLSIVATLSAAIGLSICIPQAQADDCTGMPSGAAMTLPQPLSRWAELICTPYGQIITNHQGWIWSNPGSYSPVFIPSQMVVSDPKSLGNNSYFTKIQLTKVEGDEFQSAYSVFHGRMAPDPKLPEGYRLDVASVSGNALVLYFFDYGSHAWGIWCPHGICDSDSRFMVLDMAHRPN